MEIEIEMEIDIGIGIRIEIEIDEIDIDKIKTEIEIEIGWSGKKFDKNHQGPVWLPRSIIMAILHILCQRPPPTA
jgi:hypothetical protein